MPLKRTGSDCAARGFFAVFALVWLLFITYGSFVPLEFQGANLTNAWRQFVAAFDRSYGSISRVDVATNFLLTIPLGFSILASWCPGHRLLNRASSALLVWLVCLLLSSAIEFGQVFFPVGLPLHQM